MKEKKITGDHQEIESHANLSRKTFPDKGGFSLSKLLLLLFNSTQLNSTELLAASVSYEITVNGKM